MKAVIFLIDFLLLSFNLKDINELANSINPKQPASYSADFSMTAYATLNTQCSFRSDCADVRADQDLELRTLSGDN